MLSENTVDGNARSLASKLRRNLQLRPHAQCWTLPIGPFPARSLVGRAATDSAADRISCAAPVVELHGILAGNGLPAATAQDSLGFVHLRRRLVPPQIFLAIEADYPVLRRALFEHEFGRCLVSSS